MNSIEKIKVFSGEIKEFTFITVERKYLVRDVIENCLLEVPDYFFTVPASTSNHHPPDERGKGGNVLHTKRVFSICNMLAKLATFQNGGEDLERDILLSAALLHDTLQYGIPPISEQKTDPYHPFYPYFYYNSKFRHPGEEDVIGQVKKNIRNDILLVVSLHMGRWTPFVPFSYTDRQIRLGKILHKADYIASRENVTVRV